MERLDVSTTKNKTGLVFINIALLSLLAGVLFGSIGAIQFIFPEFASALPFVKIRPLHVSLVVAWIFFSAVGGIYYYLPRFSGLEWKSVFLQRLHLGLFIFTGCLILFCYFIGKFGGREYWEFPPAIGILIVLSWIFFGLNFFRSVFSVKRTWPVYHWMWATGIFFFLFTFLESYLWIFPYFKNNHVRDITMQWKAYGALTGSWNMLVYGTAIFLMERTKGDTSIAYSRSAFLMYFLGLVNLLFGWAHHTYNVPMAMWIRMLAYGVSMTELIILVVIIKGWKSSLSEAKKDFHILSFRFLAASDFWILLNLVLAILISVPAINLFTHGTHITVAHAMGSTIGINTMILLSSCLFIVKDLAGSFRYEKIVKKGFWIINVSLVVFWLALITAGSIKGYMRFDTDFQVVMNTIKPYLLLFALSGSMLLIGLFMIVIPVVRVSVSFLFRKDINEVGQSVAVPLATRS